MIVRKMRIEEAISDLDWHWLFLDKFFQILGMNFLMGALLYFYEQTKSMWVKLTGYLCLAFYLLFILKLIQTTIKIIDAQIKLSKMQKILYKLILITIALAVVMLFAITIVSLAKVNLIII